MVPGAGAGSLIWLVCWYLSLSLLSKSRVSCPLCSVVGLKVEQRGKAERTVRQKCRGKSVVWEKRIEWDCGTITV